MVRLRPPTSCAKGSLFFFFLTEKVNAKGSFTLTFRLTDDGGHKLQSFSVTDLINV